MTTRLTFLFVAALILFLMKSLEAQTLRYNFAYTCKGERVIVTRCRKDSDQPGFPPTTPENDYCAVVYPDRQKRNGMQVETVELRAEVVNNLQACGAFGFGSSASGNTGSKASASTTTSGSAASGSAEYYLAEGSKFRDAKEYPKAVASLKRAIVLKPTLADAQFSLGYCYFMLKQYQDALPAFQETVRLEPNSNAHQYLLGVTYYRLHRYQEALKTLQEAVRLKADEPYSHQWLAETYADGFKEHEKAVAEYREAIRLKPDDARMHNDLGVSYSALEQFEQAASAYKEAIRLEPSDPVYIKNLGETYVALGMKEQALDTQRALQRVDPAQAKELGDYFHAIFPDEFKDEEILSYAVIMTDMDHPAASLPLYRRAILLKPSPEDLARIYCGMGDTYKALKETAKEEASYKQAITMYQRLIQQNPQKPPLQYFLAHSYLGLGQKDQALMIQKRLARLDQKYAKSLLDEINKAP